MKKSSNQNFISTKNYNSNNDYYFNIPKPFKIKNCIIKYSTDFNINTSLRVIIILVFLYNYLQLSIH